MLTSQHYDIATSLLILQGEYEPEPVIEWSEKHSSIPMFNRAMAAFKPVPADYVCHYPLPKVKRKRTDGLCDSFSSTYCLSTDAARFTRAVTSCQKRQERMIKDMEKLKAKHELSGKHEVEYSTFEKPIEDNKGAVIRIETWASITIKRSA